VLSFGLVAMPVELGASLIEKLFSENFEPENYDDECVSR
jgi:hypothetical protein